MIKLIYLTIFLIIALPSETNASLIMGTFSGEIITGLDGSGIIVSKNGSLDGLSVLGRLTYDTDNMPANMSVNDYAGLYSNPLGGLIEFTLEINGKTIDFSNYEQHLIQVFENFSGFDLLGIYIGDPDNFTEFRIYDYQGRILQNTSPLVAFEWNRNEAKISGGYSEAMFYLSNATSGEYVYANYEINTFSIGPIPVSEPPTLILLSTFFAVLLLRKKRIYKLLKRALNSYL